METHATALPACTAGSPRYMPYGTSSHAFARQAPRKKALAGSSPVHSSTSKSAMRRSSTVHRLQVLLLDAPPAPPPSDTSSLLVSEAIEQADELIEEFVWARGLIPAGECFEQFGWTEAAPPLKDIRQPVTEDQRRALASCLATPFMYDNEHLSKRAQEVVSNRSQENTRRLTNRYIVEVNGQPDEQAEKDLSSYAGQQAMARSRRRRRSNQAPFSDQILSSAPPLTGRSTSPNTERFLSRTLSSLEDDSNKLHLNESVLAEKKSVAHVDSSIDPASMSMGSPDQALFSMDHPAPVDHPKLAPGGVMSIARDDNALSAAQQEGPVIDDLTPLRKAIFDAGEIGKHMNAMNDRTNESTTDGHDVNTKTEVKAFQSACVAEPDENDHNEHVQPQIQAKRPSRNNIVPFFRPKVPRSQA
ncbi:MAG: hypothetical protein FRX49_10885 [Trebouxia sp. A1-2]|nr:MAG: hypothetical protein FRX49_10885 [Trebouxia sp. A1-2]